MLGIMGTSAAFAKAAGAKKQKNILSFISGDEDFSIYKVSCVDEIVVKTIKGGEAKEVTYANIVGTTVVLENDANTKVEIVGNVTEIEFYDVYDDNERPVNISSLSTEKCKTLIFLQCNFCTGLTALDLSANTELLGLQCRHCTGLTALDLSANTALVLLYCAHCTGLTALDLSANTALIELHCDGCAGLTALDLSANTVLDLLDCRYCTGLTALDLSANTALTELYCGYCTGLTALDLSANTALTELHCDGCAGLTLIKYVATNSDVSNSIAGAITGATAADGTVYTDSEGAYYGTIADAATAKGWTIEQL